jgi:tetratricopeptide (TPR) repeat protein
MFFRRFRLRARLPAWKTAFLSLSAILLATLLSGPLAPESVAQQPQIQINQGQPNPEEDPYGVYLPTDRTLARGISRARQRLEDGEYNEALAFLQQLLDRDEDVFVDDGTGPNHLRGLKTSAREMIAGLPTAGREMYVLLHTAAARRELKAALASGNRDELAKLVRRYFLTAPGYEAALLLAQIEFDRGHPLAAAHLYDELLADPTVAAEFEPQL